MSVALNRKYVTGTPLSENIRKDYPKVSGVLDISPEEFMGESYEVYTVHCKFEDGDDCPVEVSPEGITEVSPRRSPETVMPLPGGE